MFFFKDSSELSSNFLGLDFSFIKLELLIEVFSVWFVRSVLSKLRLVLRVTIVFLLALYIDFN